MGLWEWLRSFSIEKSLEVRNDGLTSEFDYGEEHLLDQVKPRRKESFSGRGFTWEEVEEVIEAANAPGGAYSLTDHLGQEWEGSIESVSGDPIAGSIYWEMSLTLLNPVKIEEEEEP